MMNSKYTQHQAITGEALNVNDYSPVSLKGIKDMSLQNRVDTKYVLPVEKLQLIMPQLTDTYNMLVVNEQRLSDYRTLYFDSEDFEFFRQHHAGILDRYKVRAREYLGSHMAFLEVKHKTNKGRTVKSRVQTPELVEMLPGDSGQFLNESFPYDAAMLEPKLWVEYSRMTLASKLCKERVTIDVNLHYTWEGQSIDLPHIAIVELKQETFSHNAEITRLLRQHQIRPIGFSKYCVGISLMYPHIKHNNFKRKLRYVGI